MYVQLTGRTYELYTSLCDTAVVIISGRCRSWIVDLFRNFNVKRVSYDTVNIPTSLFVANVCSSSLTKRAGANVYG